MSWPTFVLFIPKSQKIDTEPGRTSEVWTGEFERTRINTISPIIRRLDLFLFCPNLSPLKAWVIIYLFIIFLKNKWVNSSARKWGLGFTRVGIEMLKFWLLSRLCQRLSSFSNSDFDSTKRRWIWTYALDCFIWTFLLWAFIIDTFF